MKEKKLNVKVNKKILIPFVIGFIATILLLIFIFNKPSSIETLEEISYPHTVQTAYGLIEKDYDSKAELISLSKTDTKESVAEIKLNTPRVNYVGAGYQKVAEIEFTAYEDFKQYLSNNYFELYNVRDGMKPIERHLDFKYWTTTMVEVEDYSYDCINITSKEGNTTEKCTPKFIGTHLEEREVWKDISEYVYEKGKTITVGIFTEVGWYDHVEWIPTIYDVRIAEWAEWASLSVPYDNYQVFNTTGNANFTVPAGVTNVTILIVAGGAGGGSAGGGGGAGGLIYNTSYATTPNTNVSLTVGTGGAGGAGAGLNNGTDGSNSVFGTLTAIGGGGGGTEGYNGRVGGSGGGAGASNKVGGAGTAGQGYNGSTAADYGTGGGGGASTAGVGGTDGNSGHGGAGTLVFALNWSGGGGGGADSFRTKLYGNGGAGGGGNGGTELVSGGAGNAGVVNTGGGGGGSANRPTPGYGAGGAGGSGVVIVAWDVSIIVILIEPANNTNFTTTSVDFSANISDPDSLGIQNVSLLINGVINDTNTSTFEGVYNWNVAISDGNYNWTVIAYDDSNVLYNATNGTLFFSVDATPPVIDVTFPNETIVFHEINTNLFLNWTVSDDNLDECWYNWNGTNVTVTCGDEYANINITVGTNTNLTFYANDTLGNEASDSVSWAYLLFYNYETYDDEVLEGTSTTFTANLLTNGSVINLAYLNYDGTNYTGTITNHGSNNFTLSRTLTAPLVAADDTLDFYWYVYQSSFGTILDTNTQDVVNFLIDNCTTNTVVLYNFTIKDEAEQTIINKTGNDTQGKVDLQIYGFGTTTLIAQYNKSYNQTNPFAVCINSSLASGEQFNVYALIEYKATNYSTEFYNIQNATINSTLLNQNISLFDLHQTVTQAFKLIVKDSSFLAISDALVEVHRKYIDEGDYKIVELPKTDGKGESTASLVVNDVIYKFIIKKYGVTVATFDNVRAICQTPLISTCSIDFNAYASSIDIPDFEEEEDFNFTIEYNESSRTVRSVFAIPSGVPATIKLQVNKTDALGTSVCEDTLTSTSGTLSCVVPNTIGNSTVVAKIYRDGDLQAFGQIKLDQSPSDIYGGVLVALALFIMLTLLGAGMSDNPVFTVLFFMLGIILLFALNLVGGGGFIGASATILWLIIAIIIVIIKGGNRS